MGLKKTKVSPYVVIRVDGLTLKTFGCYVEWKRYQRKHTKDRQRVAYGGLHWFEIIQRMD